MFTLKLGSSNVTKKEIANYRSELGAERRANMLSSMSELG